MAPNMKRKLITIHRAFGIAGRSDIVVAEDVCASTDSVVENMLIVEYEHSV